MKMSFGTAGFGAAVTAGLVLAIVGHPQPPTVSSITVAPSPALALKSVAVEFPDSTLAFPAGPGAEAITANCLSCHSADMVLMQPNLPAASWSAIVDKMIRIYKAPIAEADVSTIVGYLQAIKTSN